MSEDAKNATVLECTWTLNALEALRYALYKFKTYLLTYLLTYTIVNQQAGDVLTAVTNRAAVTAIAYIIHHFYTLSLQAQNLPFQQILPTSKFKV